MLTWFAESHGGIEFFRFSESLEYKSAEMEVVGVLWSAESNRFDTSVSKISYFVGFHPVRGGSAGFHVLGNGEIPYRHTLLPGGTQVVTRPWHHYDCGNLVPVTSSGFIPAKRSWCAGWLSAFRLPVHGQRTRRA